MRFVAELAEVTGKRENDFLFIEPYSIGDAIHTLGLLPRFREVYCEPEQRIILLCQQRAFGLIEIMRYADHFVSADLAPFELHLEYAASLHNGLTPQLPIICAPDMHALGKLGRARLNPIASKKSLFFLDQDDAWIGPSIPEALRKSTEERLAALGLARGKGLIVSAHCHTFDHLPSAFWASATAIIKERFPGLRVFTDATTGAPVIDGTESISLTLAEMIPAVEYAGAALVVRSGLADLLAHARANIVSVVPPVAAYKFAPLVPQIDFFVRTWFPDTTVTDVAITEADLTSAHIVASAFKAFPARDFAPCT